jgi:acetyl-CoA synthetase
MIEHFISKTQYISYEDFRANYRVSYPEDFNFATHVVDAWAQAEPERRALTWCDDQARAARLRFRISPACPVRRRATLRRWAFKRAIWSCCF